MKKLISLLSLLLPYFLYSQTISGNYFSVSSKCKISLKIDKINHFVFDIHKGKRILGTVRLTRESKVTYLNFKNDIGGMFSNDTIFIQNSGNSMNPYLHFKECNENFIHLVRKRFP